MSLRQIYFLYLYPVGRVDRLTMHLGLVPLFLAGAGVHLAISLEGPDWFFFDCFLFTFALMLAVKRLNDRGRPSWFLFLGLAPVAWLLSVLAVDIAHREVWVASAAYVGWLTIWLAIELFALPSRPTTDTGPDDVTLAGGIDAFVDTVGRVVAWICITQVVVVATNVILRYVLRIGPVALQELEWHMMSPIALIGMCYALRYDDHVKVDIFYAKFRNTTRALIDAFAAVATIIICVLMIDFAAEFVRKAYFIDEGSPDPGGLPHRWLLRSFIPIGFTILAMQSVSNLIKLDPRMLLRRLLAG